MALDPYRMVGGETTAQRIARIRAETGAGAFSALPLGQRGPTPQNSIDIGAAFAPGPVAPQAADERNAAYLLRSTLEGVSRGIGNRTAAAAANPFVGVQPLVDGARDIGSGVSQTLGWLGSTPVQAKPVAAAPTGPQFDPSNPFADVGLAASQRSGSTLDTAQAAIAALGGRVTSGLRSVEHNKAVGGVGNSMHLTGEGMDIAKGNGMTLEKAKAALSARGIAVTEAIDEGDHFHIGWRPAGGAGGNSNPLAAGPGMFASAFDPTYANAALGELNRGQAAASQPFEVTAPAVAAPKVPELATAAPTDWTQADKSLQAMRPEEVSDIEMARTVRQNTFRGIGEALLRTPDGAGLGKVLAMIGGGALAGRSAGVADVQQKLDLFDQRMAQWRSAVTQQDVRKAQVAHQEAEHIVDTSNKQALAQFDVDLQRFNKDNFVSAGENGVTVSRTGADGRVTVRTIPNAGAIAAGFAAKRASVYSDMFGQAQQARQAQLSPYNSIVAAAAVHEYQQGKGGADGEAALAQLPGFWAGYAVEGGYAPSLFGGAESETWKGAQQEAMRRAGLMAPPQNVSEREAYNTALAGMVAQQALDPSMTQFRRQLLEYGSMGRSLSVADQFRARRTRTTTDSRGRTSTQTTEGM